MALPTQAGHPSRLTFNLTQWWWWYDDIDDDDDNIDDNDDDIGHPFSPTFKLPPIPRSPHPKGKKPVTESVNKFFDNKPPIMGGSGVKISLKMA